MKEKAVYNFLFIKVPLKDIIDLHNKMSAENNNENYIYVFNEENINKVFKTPFDAINSIDEYFDKDSMYFAIVNGSFTTDILSFIDYHELANYVIDNGDSDLPFDTTDFLCESFIEYAYDLLQEEYSLQQVKNWVETSQVDFLMDDWNDIILEFENVVAFCPHCNSVVFANAKHEYIYETAKILWECDNCGEEFVN